LGYKTIRRVEDIRSISRLRKNTVDRDASKRPYACSVRRLYAGSELALAPDRAAEGHEAQATCSA